MRLTRDPLARFRAGEARAFAELVREFDPLVRKTVGLFFRGTFEREDAMQEVWAHVFKNRDSLDPTRSEAFPGWLAVLARRKCVDLRRRDRRTSSSSTDEEQAGLLALAAPPDQELAAEAVQLERAVVAFRAGLRPGWKEFFELHFVGGLPYEEVAERLGISRLRCKYLKRVLASQASRDPDLRAALGRYSKLGGHLA